MTDPAPIQPLIPLCVPQFPGNARRYVNEAIDSTYVSSVGPFVERFEQAFAAAVGAPFAVACSTGTAAIHLALRVLDVGPNDLVLCSDFTFIASANPVVYQGADVAFVDSETRSWNLDPALLAQALDDCVAAGRRPKAVILAHVLGQAADIGPVLDACARHDVPLVEDAAEALGASYTAAYPHPACAGRQVGTLGRVGCFSFNGNKIITTGGGGMMTTSDGALARRLKHLSTQAKLPGLAFVHDEVGYNYRLTNLAAALGLGQLECLPDFLARKGAIAARYRDFARDHDLAMQPALAESRPSWWLPSLLLPGRRDAVLRILTEHNIGARPLWQPLSAQPCHRGRRHWGGAVARRLADDGLSLPCSTGLTDREQERVLEVLGSALAASAGTPHG